MSGSLAAFQDAFVAALTDAPGSAAGEVAALVGQPGFAVYRNTLAKGCVDALRANFPAVERLVGEEWFAAAAALYAREKPPRRGPLLEYGEDFPAFLQDFEPALALPYLSGVAQLDRLWLEAFSAVEQPVLALAALATQTPEQLARQPLVPRAALRWRWFAELPVYSIWSWTREGRQVPAELVWQGEGVLLSRSAGRIGWQPLERAGCAFLDACAAGRSLEQASEQALAVQPQLDFNDLLGRLLAAGAFAALVPTTPST
ncbi:DNA-binding domain-containing protein [Stutzerimonas kunmingensis]|uniref:DNA-binding domain-containing protein n=1 Tax=Stutzerimonas kunmingensis TaxID=1211807 RepID=UPI002FC691A2